MPAAASAQAPESQWRIWLEPKVIHAPVSMRIAGSKETEMVAGIRDSLSDDCLTKNQWEALKVSQEAFFKIAQLNANADLASLKPQFVRDSKKVIEYAVLSSEKAIVASAVLGTKFLAMFEATLGDKLLVVVPSRSKAFVFPKLASEYAQYASVVIEAYQNADFPVSLEVFEVSAEGWKVIGIYEP